MFDSATQTTMTRSDLTAQKIPRPTATTVKQLFTTVEKFLCVSTYLPIGTPPMTPASVRMAEHKPAISWQREKNAVEIFHLMKTLFSLEFTNSVEVVEFIK